MNYTQLERMHTGAGFIAALDQSGGSTPKALKAYGVEEGAWKTEDEMFDLVHEMRTRIIKAPSFTAEKILAAILFEKTMDRKIDDLYTGDYLWDVKGVVPILKIDKGLEDEQDHVRRMKPIPGLDATLDHAHKDRHIFGTKERSVILDYDEKGIRDIVDQQFEIGETVWSHGMVPILEPEVDIHSPHKAECEKLLNELLLEKTRALKDEKFMFKVSIPTQDDLYAELMEDPHTVRVVALSGGYSQKEACERLTRNHGMIASFSRAFAQDLRKGQTDAEFDENVRKAADLIYAASIT